MIKLVKSEDLKLLKVGAILYKDLRENPKTSTLELYDAHSFNRYQIHQITMEYYQLAILEDEIPTNLFEINGMIVSGIGNNPPILNKTGLELCSESKWWIETKKISN